MKKRQTFIFYITNTLIERFIQKKGEHDLYLH